MSIRSKPKNVVLCEDHSDVLNRFVQQKIVSFLKIKGYTNFFLEGEEAISDTATLTNKIQNVAKQLYICLAKEFKSSFFVETYPTDKCISNQYYYEVSYPISQVLFKSIIADGFMLHGFDISKNAFGLNSLIGATKGICNPPFMPEDTRVDPALIKEFITCISQPNLSEVIQVSFGREIGIALANCYLAPLSDAEEPLPNSSSSTELSSPSEEQMAADLQEIIDRDATIVSNVLSLANQYSGNIFHMGTNHCFDLIKAISSAPSYNDDFFIIWPQSIDSMFHAFLDLIEHPKYLLETVSAMLPVSYNFTMFPEDFIITNESTIYDIIANHMEIYSQDNKMNLFCNLQNVEDVDACFTKFATMID